MTALLLFVTFLAALTAYSIWNSSPAQERKQIQRRIQQDLEKRRSRHPRRTAQERRGRKKSRADHSGKSTETTPPEWFFKDNQIQFKPGTK